MLGPAGGMAIDGGNTQGGSEGGVLGPPGGTTEQPGGTTGPPGGNTTEQPGAPPPSTGTEQPSGGTTEGTGAPPPSTSTEQPGGTPPPPGALAALRGGMVCDHLPITAHLCSDAPLLTSPLPAFPSPNLPAGACAMATCETTLPAGPLLLTEAGGATYFGTPCATNPAGPKGTLAQCSSLDITGKAVLSSCEGSDGGKCYLEATVNGETVYVADHGCADPSPATSSVHRPENVGFCPTSTAQPPATDSGGGTTETVAPPPSTDGTGSGSDTTGGTTAPPPSTDTSGGTTDTSGSTTGTTNTLAPLAACDDTTCPSSVEVGKRTVLAAEGAKAYKEVRAALAASPAAPA